MKIFEKILLGFLILVFIGSLFNSCFYGTFSFYSFLDALTNTLLWGIPCLVVWGIIKLLIHFTKKIEETEKTKKKEETEMAKKAENISKKIIILVLIVLIIINTIFWLNLTIKTFAGSLAYLEREIKKKGLVWGVPRDEYGRKDWARYKTKNGVTIDEEIRKSFEAEGALRNTLTYKMIATFEGNESMLIAFLIVSDVVLIAISFMINLLYKKE